MAEQTNNRGRFARCALALAAATRADVDEATLEIYWRALHDVPIKLLEEASIELAATAKFMPKPVEWRQAVDEVLDRRQRLQEIAGPNGQPKLPGEIGEYECPVCENTGWEFFEKECDRPACVDRKPGETHTHRWTKRCTNTFCQKARQQKAERDRRYARRAQA